MKFEEIKSDALAMVVKFMEYKLKLLDRHGARKRSDVCGPLRRLRRAAIPRSRCRSSRFRPRLRLSSLSPLTTSTSKVAVARAVERRPRHSQAQLFAV